MSWKKAETCDETRYMLYAPGLIGKNYSCGNAHTIEAGFHYNGSGGTAFGGADSWPHVRVDVTFQEGEVEKRDAFVQKLKKWLTENLPS